MKTINAINTFTDQNLVIQMYTTASNDEYNRQRDNWRNRYFNIRFDSTGEVHKVSNKGNFLFGAAQDEFSQFIFKKPYSHNWERDTRRVYFELKFNGEVKLQFQVRAKIDIDGVYLTYETNFRPMKEKNNCHIKIKSNASWDKFDLKSYFTNNVLKEYLFQAGLIHNIQLVYNCDKKKAIEHYRFLKTTMDKPEEVDMEKAYRQLLKKKNILADAYTDLRTMKRANAEYGKQPHKVTLRKFNPIAIMEELSEEHDTEEGLMSAASEIINDRKILFI